VRIRLTDPAQAPSLIEFLRGTVNCVAERVGEEDVEVSLLGSYDEETHDLAVALLIRAWEAADPSDRDRSADSS
jgi:hypothetical protein